MATTTLTTTTWNNAPIFHHGPGVVVVSGVFNSGATIMGTAGDTVFLCKIPHGAVILDAREDHSTGATSSIYDLGLQTGAAAGGGAGLQVLIKSGAGATSNRVNVLAPAAASGINQSQGVPFQVSVSDVDPNRYATLVMTASGGQATATTSLIINWWVMYHDRGTF